MPALNRLLLIILLVPITAFRLPYTLKFGPVPPVTANGYYINSVMNESVSPAMSDAMVRQYFEQNLTQDAKSIPVNITLKDFTLTETLLPGGTLSIQIKLAMSFGLQKDYGNEYLVDYGCNRHFTRSAADKAGNQAQLYSILKNSIDWFNNWMKINLPVNRKLAKNISVRFSDFSEATEGDTIYYRPERPLTWADFKWKKATYSSRYAAEVIPGFGYDEKDTVINSTIRVSLIMKTFLPKSACWVNPYAKSNDVLEHEQKHFDIAQIVAAQFRQKILDEKLTPDNYEAFISMQYLDSYRAMDKMQTLYDKETRHGLDTYAQQQWNERIAKDLKHIASVSDTSF